MPNSLPQLRSTVWCRGWGNEKRHRASLFFGTFVPITSLSLAPQGEQERTERARAERSPSRFGPRIRFSVAVSEPRGAGR
jgi:hypothetical protein